MKNADSWMRGPNHRPPGAAAINLKAASMGAPWATSIGRKAIAVIVIPLGQAWPHRQRLPRQPAPWLVFPDPTFLTRHCRWEAVRPGATNAAASPGHPVIAIDRGDLRNPAVCQGLADADLDPTEIGRVSLNPGA